MQTSFFILPKHFVWILNCGRAFILSRQFQYLNAHFLKFVRNKSEAYSILWWIRRLNMHKPIFLSLINPQQSFAIFFLWRPFLGKFNQNKYFYDEGPRIFESKVNFSRFSKKQILIYGYRISSYSFLSWIVFAAKIQFIKSKIEILRQLFEFAAIYKFKKE